MLYPQRGPRLNPWSLPAACLYIVLAACAGFGAGIAVSGFPGLIPTGQFATAGPPLSRAVEGFEVAVETPEIVEPDTRPRPVTSEPVQPYYATHTLQPGETLWAVARAYNTTARELARYNGIVDADFVRAGSKLRIPGNRGGLLEAVSPAPRLAVPIPLNIPVPGPVSSQYGYRWGRQHEGIDIASSYGQEVRAAAEGRVIYAGYRGTYGNLVILEHTGKTETWYGHLSRISVKVGQKVARSGLVGRVGSTGHSTGPHLHFEVRVRGRAIDPSFVFGINTSQTEAPGASPTKRGTSGGASQT